MKKQIIEEKMDKYVSLFKSIKYIAVDQDGKAYLYTEKPFIREEDNTFWSVDYSVPLFLCYIKDKDLINNWEETLTKIG